MIPNANYAYIIKFLDSSDIFLCLESAYIFGAEKIACSSIVYFNETVTQGTTVSKTLIIHSLSYNWLILMPKLGLHITLIALYFAKIFHVESIDILLMRFTRIGPMSQCFVLRGLISFPNISTLQMTYLDGGPR